MFCLGRLWLDRGGIAPELKTDDMTQIVGVGQDGRLWTAPTGGASEEEIEDLDARVTALENGGGMTTETGTFHVTIGSTTIQGGKWEKIGDVVYFYVPNTVNAIMENATLMTLIPDSGQPTIPECAIKYVDFHRVATNLEYGMYGRFIVTSGGAYATIDNISSFMQDFDTQGNRNVQTNSAYYWQYMTIQFTAMVI